MEGNCTISWVNSERQVVGLEGRGPEEEGQGTQEEGKAKEEGTPPRGRRARKMRQGRHDPWYDEGDQTKSSEEKGRRETVYHTARAGDVPDIRAEADARRRLERARRGGTPGHGPLVRREARTEAGDLEAGIPPGRNRRGRPRPEGQAAAQVRRVRPLRRTGQDQRKQRQQRNGNDRDEPDGLPVQEARRRREAVALRRPVPHEGGAAGAAHPLPLDLLQAHRRRGRGRPARRDAVPPEEETEGPKTAPRQDRAGPPHSRRQAGGRQQAQPVRALRDGHRRLPGGGQGRAARARRPEEQAVRHRARRARHPGRGRPGAAADGPARCARRRALRHDRQRLRVPGPGEDQGRRRMRRLLHAGLRLVGEGIRRELQPARAQVVPQGDRLREVHARRDAQAGEGRQLDPPKAARREDRVRIRHGPRQDRVGAKEETGMKVFELLPRPLGRIFRKLTHLGCNSPNTQWM